MPAPGLHHARFDGRPRQRVVHVAAERPPRGRSGRPARPGAARSTGAGRVPPSAGQRRARRRPRRDRWAGPGRCHAGPGRLTRVSTWHHGSPTRGVSAPRLGHPGADDGRPAPGPSGDRTGRRPGRWVAPTLLVGDDPLLQQRRALSATLQTVLDQDPVPAELQIEVVDDASTLDDPEAVVRSFAGARLVTTANRRTSARRPTSRRASAGRPGDGCTSCTATTWCGPGSTSATGAASSRAPTPSWSVPKPSLPMLTATPCTPRPHRRPRGLRARRRQGHSHLEPAALRVGGGGPLGLRAGRRLPPRPAAHQRLGDVGAGGQHRPRRVGGRASRATTGCTTTRTRAACTVPTAYIDDCLRAVEVIAANFDGDDRREVRGAARRNVSHYALAVSQEMTSDTVAAWLWPTRCGQCVSIRRPRSGSGPGCWCAPRWPAGPPTDRANGPGQAPVCGAAGHRVIGHRPRP